MTPRALFRRLTCSHVRREHFVTGKSMRTTDWLKCMDCGRIIRRRYDGPHFYIDGDM